MNYLFLLKAHLIQLELLENALMRAVAVCHKCRQTLQCLYGLPAGDPNFIGLYAHVETAIRINERAKFLHIK